MSVVFVVVALVLVVHVPSVIAVVFVVVALMLGVLGVMFVGIALVLVMHVPSLIGVVLVGIALVLVVFVGHMLLHQSSFCCRLLQLVVSPLFILTHHEFTRQPPANLVLFGATTSHEREMEPVVFRLEDEDPTFARRGTVLDLYESQYHNNQA